MKIYKVQIKLGSSGWHGTVFKHEVIEESDQYYWTEKGRKGVGCHVSKDQINEIKECPMMHFHHEFEYFTWSLEPDINQNLTKIKDIIVQKVMEHMVNMTSMSNFLTLFDPSEVEIRTIDTINMSLSVG